jgi:hypothetical protein
MNAADDAAQLLAAMPPEAFEVVLRLTAQGRPVMVHTARPDARAWSTAAMLLDGTGEPITIFVVEDDPKPGAGRSLGPGRARGAIRRTIAKARAVVIHGSTDAWTRYALQQAVAAGAVHGKAVLVQCAWHAFADWRQAVAQWTPKAEMAGIAPASDSQVGRA